MERERGFRNRREAGQVLASLLAGYRGRSDIVVVGLPRGGIPVAYEIATALHAPLDVMVVRKLGVPGHEELAMGAIASGGVQVINEEVVRHLGLTPAVLASVAAIEQQELVRRERTYRGERPPVAVDGGTVILVDDGLATGSTMRAAVAALRRRQPGRIIVAVPTAAPETCEELKTEVDEIVCAMTPTPFYGVGEWYEHFDQTSDNEVRDLLERAAPALNRGRTDRAI
jgi:putative phosphoribosyl transferase